MNRRDFLKISGAATAAMALRSATGAAQPSNKKPNIIFIMADDLGYKELGCYGQQKIKTPNIDKLAAEGMRFTDYYTGSAVCAPARCNLMTGKHGGHAYIRDNSEVGGWDSFRGQIPLSAEALTIAELLKQQGYVTGAFGKWGLGEVGSTGDPLNQGFDRFFGYNCQRHAHNLYPTYLVSDRGKVTLDGNTRGLTGEKYAPQVIADEMLKFIRENRDRRFFVYYPTVIPHLALQVSEEDLNQYKGKWPETPYEGKSYLAHPTPRACYAAMISFMDRQVGRIMKLLKDLNLDDNTVVFFTSDNGTTYLKGQVDYEFFDSVGPLHGLKGSLYEGGIRVPMIVRWPGKTWAGSTSGHIAAHYDILATLAEIAGAEALGDTDGTSFVPTLLSEPDRQKKPDYLFWDFAGYGGQLAVRMGKWKGIKNNLRKNPDSPLELYDLENDISEANNVADKYPDVAAKIAKIMVEARTRPLIEKFRFGRYSD
ncbi:MAG: sulfatase-like hydrolase/transferase [Planctomycetota bacterium]